MLEARLAQVHVHVDKAGRNHQARGIERLRAGRRQIRAHRGNRAILNQNVGQHIGGRSRVDDAPVFDEELTH